MHTQSQSKTQSDLTRRANAAADVAQRTFVKPTNQVGKTIKTVRVQGGERHTIGARPGSLNINMWSSQNHIADINEFMRQFGYVGSADMDRRCSERTYDNRKSVLLATFAMLKERNRGLNSLSQLTPRLIPQILAGWQEPSARGSSMRLGFDTQVQSFSVLTWFWRMHAISVQSIKHYIDDTDLRKKYVRTSVAVVDKSWEAKGLNVDDMIKRVSDVDPVAGRLLRLATTYGLRMRETLMFKPHEADKGDALHVTRGTKTGRERTVDFASFDAQTMRRELDALKAELTPDQHAAWAKLSLAQARGRLKYILNKCGINKRELGVTMHGLRAQWAINEFERLSGTTAPVRGGGAVDYRRFNEVRRTISRALGHNRIRVTSAYYGSFFKMRGVAEDRFDASWALLEPHLPDLRDLAEDFGITNLWMVGRRANGANTVAGDDFEFLIDESVHKPTAMSAASALGQMLEDRLKFIVTVHVAHAATNARKLGWSENALPLFAVDAPELTLPSQAAKDSE